jgi:hypothetical protein
VDLAQLHARRGFSGDAARTSAHAREALEQANALGMERVARHASRLLEASPSVPGDADRQRERSRRAPQRRVIPRERA